MERDPHQLIEGMAISAYAIGAHVAYVYVRGEYVLGIRGWRQAIAEPASRAISARGYSGRISTSTCTSTAAPAPISAARKPRCSTREEGAAAAEAPFPAVAGLYASPTVINNVETLACVPHIVLRGPDWFRGIGPRRAPARSSTA